MTENFRNEEKIEYPCKWLYKVIGRERVALEKALEEVVPGSSSSMKGSNISNKGNYLSFNIEIYVKSEEERNRIYEKLKNHPAVKVVL